MRARAPIAFGLALVENAYEETARIEGVLPEDFEKREEELLALAKRWLARLPFANADLLIIDEIGKNISGSGMDTNIVGRKRAFRLQPMAEGQPQMRHIFVRGLSDRTHGNAAGIGLADFTTTRLVKSMDYRATVVNCLTAGHPEGANLPVHFETDREAIEAALVIIGNRLPEQAQHHADTKHACRGGSGCVGAMPRGRQTPVGVQRHRQRARLGVRFASESRRFLSLSGACGTLRSRVEYVHEGGARPVMGASRCTISREGDRQLGIERRRREEGSVSTTAPDDRARLSALAVLSRGAAGSRDNSGSNPNP